MSNEDASFEIVFRPDIQTMDYYVNELDRAADKRGEFTAEKRPCPARVLYRNIPITGALGMKVAELMQKRVVESWKTF